MSGTKSADQPTTTVNYPSSLNVMQPELATVTHLNQPETFLVVLEMFIQQHETFRDDVESAIRTNNGPELHILIHTLKGSSGALGLQKLHEISTELDLQLTQRVDIESLNMTPLFDVLRLSLVDCRNILELNKINKDDLSNDEDADLVVLLRQLRQKLHHHEHINSPFIDILRSVLHEQNNRKYDQVLELVDRFEYSEAYQSLLDLESKN